MKAIILAAGQGTRLRPLTDDRPKCLVELAGSSLLDHNLRAFRAAGVTDIAVIGGYRADSLPTEKIELVVNPKFAETNMVTTLFCARRLINSGTDIIIGYGDCIYEPRVLAEVVASKAPVALAIDRQWRRYWEKRMDDPLSDAETLKLDGNMQVTELGKKPSGYEQIEGQYMGLFKIRADHAARISEVYDAIDRAAIYDGKNFDNMYMTSFLQHLIDIGWRVQSVPVDNGWLEVDTPEDLRLYEELRNKGKLDDLCRLS